MSQTAEEAATEPELVARMIEYQAGDLQAFQRLFALLAPELARFFAGRRPDGAAADDLVQETFLALHRVRRTYRPPLPVRPWVFGIARNVERRNRRQAVRRREHELPSPAFGTVEGEPLLAAGPAPDPGAGHDLRRALRQIPPSRRQAWVLHHVHGLSFPEIAARLRIGLDAAKLRSSRAMSALRSLLGGTSRG